MIKKAIVLIIICCSLFINGCAGLMLAERERQIDEDYQEGRIDKSQYLLLKSRLDQDRANPKAGKP